MRTRHLTIRLTAAVALSLAPLACAQAPGGAGDLPRPATPRCILWAIPGVLRIDPMTGKPHNPHVRDRD